MRNIAEQHTVLKLNKLWQEVGVSSVGSALVDLVAGTVFAMDIDYELDENGKPIEGKKPVLIQPVSWDEWVQLEVRPYDQTIRSINMEIRVPTVVIARNYDRMPRSKPGKNPSNSSVRLRDGNRCQYTNKLLKDGEGNVDHVVPLSKGGTNTWDNVVWADRSINSKKGNKLNKEVGLKLVRPVRQPREVEAWEKIGRPKHRDWIPFMRKFASQLD